MGVFVDKVRSIALGDTNKNDTDLIILKDGQVLLINDEGPYTISLFTSIKAIIDDEKPLWTARLGF